MTSADRFEATIAEWLDAESAFHLPAHLGEVVAQTAVTRQRPWWSSLERWLPMDISTRRVDVPSRVPVRTIAILAVLALLIAGLVVVVGSRPAPLPAPFGPATNGAMAYWAEGDIYLADPDGTRGRPIVTGPANDHQPLFSPDGTRFTFLRDVSPDLADVMVARANGGDVRALTAEPLRSADWVEWSPAGDRLAVVHVVGGKRVLSILDVAGGGIVTLPTGGIEVDDVAFWRPPDGASLVFTTRAVAGGTGSGIYSIRPDGTGLRLMSNGIAGDDNDFQGLAASPDGAVLAYWNWEDGVQGSDGYTHLLDTATGRDRTVAFDFMGRSAVAPRFSPDGTSIVAASTHDGPLHLFIAPTDGSAVGRPVGGPVSITEHYWVDFSPDGSKLILALDDTRAYIVDVASGDIEETGSSMPFFGSWQRTLPDDR